ncbi:hypothetical protein THAOC_10505, partial [Thalassiosira oceanica]
MHCIIARAWSSEVVSESLMKPLHGRKCGKPINYAHSLAQETSEPCPTEEFRARASPEYGWPTLYILFSYSQSGALAVYLPVHDSCSSMYYDSYNNFIPDAIDIVSKAIAADNEGDYDKALSFYRDALSRFTLGLKYEKNESRKKLIIERVEGYMKRAEELRDYLNKQAEVDKQGGGGSGGGSGGAGTKPKGSGEDDADAEKAKLRG